MMPPDSHASAAVLSSATPERHRGVLPWMLHEAAPGGEVLPCGQGVQEEAPGALKEPGAHKLQALEAGGAKLPAGQARQPTEPGAALVKPPAQAGQLPAPAPL
jgi:hypothetical protein